MKTQNKARAGFFGAKMLVQALCVLFSLTPAASAVASGEKLRLRTGDVDLTNASEAASALLLPDFDAAERDEPSSEDSRRPAWVSTKKLRTGKSADARTVRHFVVQMRDTISTEDLNNFDSLKLKPVRYLPDNAVVIASTARRAQVLARSSNRIRAISLYNSNWKISPDFGAPSVFSGDPVVQAIVRLFPDQDVKSLKAKFATDSFKKSKIDVKKVAARTVLVSAKRSALRTIANIDSVEWIEPVPEIELPWFRDDALKLFKVSSPGDYSDINGFESGTKLMKFDAAWARGFAGEGQSVGVADTGMDLGDIAKLHPDFETRIPQGGIFGLFSKSWEDPMGHGTHVAGSVAADGKASGGKIPGGATEAKVLPQSMWSPLLDNLSVPTKLKDMFGKAYDTGARVHTNSWGSAAAFGVYDSMAQQVDEFIYANPDFLILFAAGNSGEDADRDGRVDGSSVSTPGTAKNALTVGASKNLVATGGIQAKLIELRAGKDKWGVEPLASSRLSENENGIAPFSSRGPTADGRLKPEVVAPGTNILSARSRHPKAQALWGAYNGEYVWSGGTSMSTPLVAGAAAVVREYLIKDRKIAEPTAALVKAVLMHTAEDLFPGQFGEVGASRGQELATVRPNMDEGYGRVDVSKATTLQGSLLVDERVGLGPGDRHMYPLTLSKSTELSATLVYSDAPGASGAAQALVNDLDLSVIDSRGQRYEISDRLNNNEHVALALPAGIYQIEVRGFNVPMAKQSYALIVSAVQ